MDVAACACSYCYQRGCVTTTLVPCGNAIISVWWLGLDVLLIVSVPQLCAVFLLIPYPLLKQGALQNQRRGSYNDLVTLGNEYSRAEQMKSVPPAESAKR